MRLAEGAYIINATRLEKQEEIDESTEDIERDIESEKSEEKQVEAPARESLDSEEESF